MRIDRYTQKMQEALQSAQDFATQWQSPEIGNEHFLLALLDQVEGVTRPLLEKIGVSADALRSRLETELAGRPKVSGGGLDFRTSKDFRSGEGRVGEEGRSRWGPDHLKKKKRKAREGARLDSGPSGKSPSILWLTWLGRA